MSRVQATETESAIETEAPVEEEHDDTTAPSSVEQSLGELGVQPVQRRASGSPSFVQSLGEIRAIQRIAKGEGSTTEDVQQTALAGVAGAGQTLPHAGQIQRSFGKHDISGVRAQVGGDAAAASAALGAEAYATGDRVAFARQPDLHTAAHEAAHTVQQRSGKVSRKGLGAVNDVHEQDADQVADAVVAGESAEALLDEATGGTSPTEAHAGPVQLKPKLSDATAKEQEAQSSKAASASKDAAKDSVKLVALRMRAAGDELEQIIQTDPKTLTAAHWAPHRARAQQLIDETVADVDGLKALLRESANASKANTSEANASKANTSKVDAELAMLRASNFHVEHKVTAAFDHFKKVGDPLDHDPSKPKIKMAVAALHADLGLTGADQDRTGSRALLLGNNNKEDPDAEDKLRRVTLDTNIAAAFASAHAVRMGMTTGGERAVVADLRRLIAHLTEIDALLAELTGDLATTGAEVGRDSRHKPANKEEKEEQQQRKTSLAALKQDLPTLKPRFNQLAAEVAAIDKEDDARPVVGIRDKELEKLMAGIKTKAGI